jgi:hypothetical protein
MAPAAAAAQLLRQLPAPAAVDAGSLCQRQRLLQQCLLLKVRCRQGGFAAPDSRQQLMVQRPQSPCRSFQHPAVL